MANQCIFYSVLNGEVKKKSPRHYMKFPPSSYREWLASASEDISTLECDKSLLLGDVKGKYFSSSSFNEKDEKQTEWPYHSFYLDTLMEEQSGDEKHVCYPILGSLDDIKADLEKHARKQLFFSICSFYLCSLFSAVYPLLSFPFSAL